MHELLRGCWMLCAAGSEMSTDSGQRIAFNMDYSHSEEQATAAVGSHAGCSLNPKIFDGVMGTLAQDRDPNTRDSPDVQIHCELLATIERTQETSRCCPRCV